MAVEPRGPAVGNDSDKKEGKGELIKAPISLQDLRRSLYVKAKAEPTWRFWGLYVHVCKMETLHEAYQVAKSKDGAPGIDGVTFEAIAESGVESFLKQIQDELVHEAYQPMRVRKKEIPKDGGTKVRVLSIPAIRDRVVQGALKLILEPIFEADFQSGSYGYRPKRTAHEAVLQVDKAIMEGKKRIIDLDLRAYFGAPGQARRFQRVRFPPRKGNEPSHRESSLGLMKVTTWVKRRQSNVQAVTQVKRLSLVTHPEADRVEYLEGNSRRPQKAMVAGDSGGV
jgi:RNA-directed DNA polymerase